MITSLPSEANIKQGHRPSTAKGSQRRAKPKQDLYENSNLGNIGVWGQELPDFLLPGNVASTAPSGSRAEVKSKPKTSHK